MPRETDYLGRPIEQWTEADLRHAQAHPHMIRESLREAVNTRRDAAEASQRLVHERVRALTEKRKLLSGFVDVQSKPAGSIDTRSVKHAVSDATSDKKGRAGISFAGLVAAYEWVNNHPEIPWPDIPPMLWLALIFMGAAVWCVKLAENLYRKFKEEHNGG